MEVSVYYYLHMQPADRLSYIDEIRALTEKSDSERPEGSRPVTDQTPILTIHISSVPRDRRERIRKIPSYPLREVPGGSHYLPICDFEYSCCDIWCPPVMYAPNRFYPRMREGRAEGGESNFLVFGSRWKAEALRRIHVEWSRRLLYELLCFILHRS